MIESKHYPGNKASFGSFQQIINHFPPHQHFISGCAGSGAIEKRKRLAGGENIIIEKNQAVIKEFWNEHHGYHIVNGDCVTWLYRYKPLLGPVVMYFDVPYWLPTRNGGNKIYRHEWNTEKHKDFLQLIISIPASIVISHYACSLYDKALKGWNKHSWPVMTQQGKKDECIYFNFDKPTELHQYDYLGDNFTDRQRIKRKIDRLLSKLSELPPLERAALISALGC